MALAPPPAPAPERAPHQAGEPGPARRRWLASDHGQVGLSLLAVAAALLGWTLFWPVPTEVVGQGVLLDRGGPSRQLGGIAYFAPADALRLPFGLPVEVVPQWNQRGRFGGLVGEVRQVWPRPATESEIASSTGNPQLAQELVSRGLVWPVAIGLSPDPANPDGYRWTLSQGSRVFPLRPGLPITGHACVEWRPPISYVIPALRDLTGGYRSWALPRRGERPSLRQSGALP